MILRGILASAVLLAALFAAPARLPASLAVAEPHVPILLVEDRRLLTRLESAGFSFESLFHASAGEGLGGLAARSPAYRGIVDTIAGDLDELRDEIAQGGRKVSEVTQGFSGSLLDRRWLVSPAARFRLAGVLPRIDRRDFTVLHAEADCGEVRFIYRLAYDYRRGGQQLASRMPFNISAVFAIPPADGTCSEATALWMRPARFPISATRLLQGPLAPGRLDLRQLEFNGQIVRFPSEEEPELAGQAAYLMRIFRLEGDRVVAWPLENTPDATLEKDEALKSDLIAWLAKNSASVDSGVYVLPDRYLARKAISWATHGSARAANRPFSALLRPSDLAGLDPSGLEHVTSPEALIARLDAGTCQGCHQSGATAGFHFIGRDEPSSSPLNRIAVGISPHLKAELQRRLAYMDALAEGRPPPRFRPLPAAPAARWTETGPAHEEARLGQACLLPGDPAAGVSSWRCEAGTECRALAAASATDGPYTAGPYTAQCMLPLETEAMFSGHPCLAGTVQTSAAQPFRDGLSAVRQFAAFEPKGSRTGYTCRPPRIGVPGGIAYRGCSPAEKGFPGFAANRPMPNEICGLAGGKAFDLCVATNRFDQCLKGAVVRGNRTACSADRLCRDDYMCQQFPADTPNVEKLAGIRGAGFCSPTYFLFQMRIDNHPAPWN